MAGRVLEKRVGLYVFGLAKEHHRKYAKDMFLATFTDRFAPIMFNFDEEDKLRILERRSERKNPKHKLPKVELPLKDVCVYVKVPSGLYAEVNRLAMLLDSEKAMSFVRAQTHIVNFVKANADLNGRKSVVEDDLKLFKLVLPLYFGARSGSVDVKVREAILECSMNGKRVAGREVKDRVTAETGCSEREVQRVLSRLREENVVNFLKVSGGRRYDFKYWL